ncbi:MAG: hypothetical protein Q4A48_00045 [Bacillota bacterium]|nr:hypothetical protein [Bacillota bacterium]
MVRTGKRTTVFTIMIAVLMSLLLLGSAPQEARADGSVPSPANVTLEAVTAGSSGYVTELVASWDEVADAKSYTVTVVRVRYGWAEDVMSLTPEDLETVNGRVYCNILTETKKQWSVTYWDHEMAVTVRANTEAGTSDGASSKSIELIPTWRYFSDDSCQAVLFLAGTNLASCMEELIREDAEGAQRCFKYDENGNTLCRRYNGDTWSKMIACMPARQYEYGSMQEMEKDAIFIPATDGSPAKKSDAKVETPLYDSLKVHILRDSDFCPETGTFHSWTTYFREGDQKASFDHSGSYHKKCADCGQEAWPDFYVSRVSFGYDDDEYPYRGKAIKPYMGVYETGGKTLKEGVDYTLKCTNNTNVGTAKAVITLQGVYEGSKTFYFEIVETDIAYAKVTGISDRTYTGKPIKLNPVIKLFGVKLKEGTDYKVVYANNTDAGKATIVIGGENNMVGSIVKTFKINKAKNPLAVKGKTATVKHSKVKKAAQKLAVSKVLRTTKKGQGTVTYTKKSGDKKITIAKKTGKVTVKKGLKKGTYTVKVKVKAAGTRNYKALTKTVTFKIKVK